MAENTFMAFKCLNPDCGKVIKINRPAKSGVYNVTCPHCGIRKQLNIKGMDAIAKETDSAAGKAVSTSAPSVPDNSANEIKEMTDDFIVDVTYQLLCPHCRKQKIGFVTNKPGHRTIACPMCKGKIGIDVRKKTEVILITDQLQMFKGKLTLLRKGWLNKDYRLREGKNVIGRYDESDMSDISIKNDSSMSRRSIEIEVRRTEKGYMFKLTVLKATNPVLHNSNPLMPGESVSLNFGDSIVLGKTKFRFDKED